MQRELGSFSILLVKIHCAHHNYLYIPQLLKIHMIIVYYINCIVKLYFCRQIIIQTILNFVYSLHGIYISIIFGPTAIWPNRVNHRFDLPKMYIRIKNVMISQVINMTCQI